VPIAGAGDPRCIARVAVSQISTPGSPAPPRSPAATGSKPHRRNRAARRICDLACSTYGWRPRPQHIPGRADPVTARGPSTPGNYGLVGTGKSLRAV